MILKRPVSQLSIRQCSTCRVHHPMHPMLVFKHIGARYHEARCVELVSAHWHQRTMQCCILSILYELLFSMPGRQSQTLQQYSTSKRTKPLQALAFKFAKFPCKFLLRKPSVRFALAVTVCISPMCQFHLRSFENHIHEPWYFM